MTERRQPTEIALQLGKLRTADNSHTQVNHSLLVISMNLNLPVLNTIHSLIDRRTELERISFQLTSTFEPDPARQFRTEVSQHTDTITFLTAILGTYQRLFDQPQEIETQQALRGFGTLIENSGLQQQSLNLPLRRSHEVNLRQHTKDLVQLALTALDIQIDPMAVGNTVDTALDLIMTDLNIGHDQPNSQIDEPIENVSTEISFPQAVTDAILQHARAGHWELLENHANRVMTLRRGNYIDFKRGIETAVRERAQRPHLPANWDCLDRVGRQYAAALRNDLRGNNIQIPSQYATETMLAATRVVDITVLLANAYLSINRAPTIENDAIAQLPFMTRHIDGSLIPDPSNLLSNIETTLKLLFPSQYDVLRRILLLTLFDFLNNDTLWDNNDRETSPSKPSDKPRGDTGWGRPHTIMM